MCKAVSPEKQFVDNAVTDKYKVDIRKNSYYENGRLVKKQNIIRTFNNIKIKNCTATEIIDTTTINYTPNKKETNNTIIQNVDRYTIIEDKLTGLRKIVIYSSNDIREKITDGKNSYVIRGSEDTRIDIKHEDQNGTMLDITINVNGRDYIDPSLSGTTDGKSLSIYKKDVEVLNADLSEFKLNEYADKLDNIKLVIPKRDLTLTVTENKEHRFTALDLFDFEKYPYVTGVTEAGLPDIYKKIGFEFIISPLPPTKNAISNENKDFYNWVYYLKLDPAQKYTGKLHVFSQRGDDFIGCIETLDVNIIQESAETYYEVTGCGYTKMNGKYTRVEGSFLPDYEDYINEYGATLSVNTNPSADGCLYYLTYSDLETLSNYEYSYYLEGAITPGWSLSDAANAAGDPPTVTKHN